MALYGFKARGSPYTVRVLALKLEEEGDQMEVSLLNSSYKLPFSFLEMGHMALFKSLFGTSLSGDKTS